MHAGRLAPGTRLWPLFMFLIERGERGATGLEITQHFRLLNPPTEVAALRKLAPAHGWHVPYAEYVGRTSEGRKVHRFRIERAFAPSGG